MSRPVTMTLSEVLSITGRAQQRPLAALRDQPRQREERKYQNVVVETADGLRFDSKAEHRRWCYLAQLQRAGEITKLQRQVAFELIPAQARPSGGTERPTVYVADFVYVDRTGTTVVEDVKGASTPEYRLKRKLMLWRHGVEIREVKA